MVILYIQHTYDTCNIYIYIKKATSTKKVGEDKRWFSIDLVTKKTEILYDLRSFLFTPSEEIELTGTCDIHYVKISDTNVASKEKSNVMNWYLQSPKHTVFGMAKYCDEVSMGKVLRRLDQWSVARLHYQIYTYFSTLSYWQRWG